MIPVPFIEYLNVRIKGYNSRLFTRDTYEDLIARDFYGKVIERTMKDENNYIVRFTSLPPEVASYFLAHQKYAEKINQKENS